MTIWLGKKAPYVCVTVVKLAVFFCSTPGFFFLVLYTFAGCILITKMTSEAVPEMYQFCGLVRQH